MNAEYSHEEATRKMPEIPLRPATEADEIIIRQMVRSERLDPTSLKWQNFLMAELDGKVVGIGQVRQHSDCRELGSLAVLPEYRGRGIAAALIAALEARTGLPMYLFTRDRTEGYYQQFGYQRIRYRDAPRSLRLKFLIPMIFRVFGVRVIMMRKG